MQGNIGFAIFIWAGRGGIGVVVPLGLSGDTIFLVMHTGLAPYQVLHFCPDLTFAMFLVMADLRSCVGEFTWYALCRQSLNNNPLISHVRQVCSGCFCTLYPDKLISSSVSLSFHSLSVDSFWTFDPSIFLAFFLEVCFLCSLLIFPLVVSMPVLLNVLKLGGSGPGWKSIFFMLLIIYLKPITSWYISSESVGYIMR